MSEGGVQGDVLEGVWLEVLGGQETVGLQVELTPPTGSLQAAY